MANGNRILAWLTALLICSPSHAALYDRGDGLIYDDVLNTTWSQDTNLFKTLATVSGNLQGFIQNVIDANHGIVVNLPNALDTPPNSGNHALSIDDFTGDMYHALAWQGEAFPIRQNWWAAKAFIGYLNEIAYKGHTNWQLPSAQELPFMIAVNLENCSGCIIHYEFKSSFTDRTSDIADNFTNLYLSSLFWTNTETTSPNNIPASVNQQAVMAGLGSGPGNEQTESWKSYKGGQIWAVLPSDVSAVPLPSSGWLFASALIGLTKLKRNKYRRG